MTKDELEQIISKGEGLTVEFKLCKNGLTNSVFETVSSFSNRYGGHIYPKNPILANFFVNIGRADSLGSGIRNLYQFSKIYSGEEPILIEDDIFKTIIPIVLSDKLGDKPKMSDILSDKKHTEKILAYVDKNGEINAAIAMKIIGRSQSTTRRILKNLVCENIFNAVGGNKNRKYTRKKQEK